MLGAELVELFEEWLPAIIWQGAAGVEGHAVTLASVRHVARRVTVHDVAHCWDVGAPTCATLVVVHKRNIFIQNGWEDVGVEAEEGKRQAAE